MCRRLKPVLLAALLFGGSLAHADELLVGGATVSITPDKPVALSGQHYTRVSEKVASPCTATALALESKKDGKAVDQAILVSCDLVSIPKPILDGVREAAKGRLKGFDVRKIVLNATHTHTAPVMDEGFYEIPKDGVMQVAEYNKFLVERLADVAVWAWEGRAAGRMGYGLGHAVVGHNRRAVYENGAARMYGPTYQPEFRGFEGYEDHGVEVLFFWNADKKLIATAVNVACPSQEVEGQRAVNADFWHPIREQLRKKHGADLLVLGWTGASGDQSPHLQYRKAAEERMRKLRGLDRLDEIARRVVDGWTEAYDGAKKDVRDNVELTHKVLQLSLPVRRVTREEYAEAKLQVEAYKDPKDNARKVWNQTVIDRYNAQTDDSTYETEVHVLRLGDVAIATNQFELFTDYGIQMKARSRAVQTFVIQLAGPASYLATERAVRGGGYSAIIQSNLVSPAGGQVLVNRTVEAINSMWPEPTPKK